MSTCHMFKNTDTQTRRETLEQDYVYNKHASKAWLTNENNQAHTHTNNRPTMHDRWVGIKFTCTHHSCVSTVDRFGGVEGSTDTFGGISRSGEFRWLLIRMQSKHNKIGVYKINQFWIPNMQTVVWYISSKPQLHILVGSFVSDSNTKQQEEEILRKKRGCINGDI